MRILLRLVRLALITILCIVLYSGVFEYLNDVAARFVQPGIGGGTGRVGLISAFSWGVFFRAPALVVTGTAPLLLVFVLLEWRSIRTILAYVGVWSAAAVFVTTAHSALPGRWVATLAAAAAVASLYWVLAGRSAGAWRSIQGGWAEGPRLKALNLASYVMLAYLAFLAAGYLYDGSKLAYAALDEPDVGTPAFRFLRPHADSLAHKVALRDFPDAWSCLEDDVSDLTADTLRRMDWGRIDNDAEAEICIFRLLASYEDIGPAMEWMTAQNFKVSPGFGSGSPYGERDGNLRVAGWYSIRNDGPKFPTSGLAQRAIRSLAYAMTIDATWDPQGKTLLGVELSYSRL